MLTTTARSTMLITRLLALVVTALLFTPVTALAQTEQVVYYHTDAIGSVRAITDAAGAVIERYDFLPFGEALPSTVLETRQFAGKERDAETGLDYFGARYHMSSIGRFTTVDPLMDVDAALVDPQRWNRYGYSLNNPFKYVDPDGKNPVLLQKLAELAHRAASSPAGQRAQQAIANQGTRAWVALTRLFNTSQGQELVQTAAELTAGADAGSSAVAGVKLGRQLAAQEIAGGHAFLKHVVGQGEFPGIRTRNEFAGLIENVMDNASHIKQLGGGRTAYWLNGVVVIRHPGRSDGGTAFVPKAGFDYFKKDLF